MFSYKQRHANWQKTTLLGILLPIFVLVSVSVSLLISLAPQKAAAATANTLTFQGRLMTPAGQKVPDGSYNMQFDLYSVSGGGSSLWTEDRLVANTQGVTVQNGYFSVRLGSLDAFPAINWDQDLWLGMTVRGTSNCAWGSCSPADLQMTPRFKLTAVPYAFRAGALVDSSGNAKTADDLAQLSPGTIQTLSTAIAALRLNQTGSGALIQFQGNGTDVFTVDKNGEAVLGAGITVGNSSTTTAGTIRWTGSDLEVYDGSGWVSLTSGGTGPGGGSANTSASFVSGVANLAGTATGTATGIMSFTSATAVSTTAGSNTFVAPADGSFRTCTVISNADRSAGTVTLRWNVNGSSVGAGQCIINGTNIRTASSAIDPGTVSFNAGDTISVVLDSSGFTPTNTDFTAYWTVEYESSAVSSFFEDGGNAFGGTATIGTTDTFGLNFITDGAVAASINSGGSVNFVNDVTVGDGLEVTNGIDNNNGGITEAGALSGVSGISSTNGLSVASGGSGNLTLTSASGTLILGTGTLQRNAAGSTTIDLLDASANTTLVLTNSDGTRVAGLTVEGAVSAASFSGAGSGLTSLSAGNISSGTLSDSRLSSNIALLNGSQTFTGVPTFDAGIILGNSSSTTAGALRWNGSEFEGYDGAQWTTLGSGTPSGGGSPSPALTTVQKTANENVNNSTTLQDDNHLFFSVGASETWSFRFVLQANTPGSAGIKFAVTAPSGATCNVAVIDHQTAASESGIGCGTSSVIATGTGANEVYEVTGTIVNGSTPGDVRLQWAQTSAVGSNTTVLTGSFLSASIQGGGLQFLQGGNNFGATAILGTTSTHGLNFITDGVTRLSISSTGDVAFSGELAANGGLVIGNASGDGLTIYSNSVTLMNGLNFDSNTLVIDSSGNFVGINTASPNNRLSLNNAATADSLAQALISSGVSSNKGLVIQGVSSQSANLLEIQSNSGGLLAGFNSGGGLVLGLTTLTSSATTNRAISLPDEAGTICLSSSTSCGYLRFAAGAFQTDASNNDVIAVNKTSATGNLIALQRSGGAVFTVANSGALQIQSTSSTALDIRNASGTSYFLVDSSSGSVVIGSGTADANGILFVLDTRTSDPTGVNGGSYYNSSLGKFRCYENGSWKDCDVMKVRSFVDSTSDAVVDANTTNYWDAAAENNNTTPNIILSASSGKAVMGIMTMEVTSTSNADVEVVGRIERGIGSVPTCGSGTAVGGQPGTFSTNSGGIMSSTVTFLDTPNTTSTVYYVVCSSTATAGTGANITRIRMTLQEVENSN